MEKLPQKQPFNLPERLQENGLTTQENLEIIVISGCIQGINVLREFPLSPDEMIEWSCMLKKVIPDANPIEVEDAIVDLASGKHEYSKSNGVKNLIEAIQKNRGQDWYYKP